MLSSKGSNIDKMVEEVYPLVHSAVNYYSSKYSYVMAVMSRDDCIQEIIMQMLKYKYFEKYDKEQKKLSSAIYQIASRWFIDQTKRRVVKSVSSTDSIDEPIQLRDGSITLGDLVADRHIDEDIEIQRLLEQIPNEDAGVRFKVFECILCEDNKGVVSGLVDLFVDNGVDDEGLSKVTLRQIAKALVSGYSVKDVRQFLVKPSNKAMRDRALYLDALRAEVMAAKICGVPYENKLEEIEILQESDYSIAECVCCSFEFFRDLLHNKIGYLFVG